MNDELPDFNKLWNYSKPEETRHKFLEIIEKVKGDNNFNYLLEINTQVARTYSLEGKFHEAHNILDVVEGKLNENSNVARIRYLLERGRTFNSSNMKEKAKDLFVDAYNLASTEKVFLYSIDAAHMVAIAETNLSEKIIWNEKGLVEAKKGDESLRRWVGVFLNNMGWDYFEEKRYVEAMDKFKECWSFHEEQGSVASLEIAKWSYAKTLRMIGNVEDSLRLQSEILTGKGNEDEGGYVYEELGELYLLKNNTEKAKVYFSKAYNILSKDSWLMRNEKARLDRLKSLSVD